MEHLQYPIGKNPNRPFIDLEEAKEMVDHMANLPKQLTTKYLALLESNLMDEPYRPGGWTARQVIHHIADSHMNAYIRTKWLLTEEEPIIKAYNENAWAKLPDSQLDAGISLSLITSLHERWTSLLSAVLSEELLLKSYFHPEYQKTFNLGAVIAMYEWHGKHHAAHLDIILQKAQSAL